jgi:hypothetical protein
MTRLAPVTATRLIRVGLSIYRLREQGHRVFDHLVVLGLGV